VEEAVHGEKMERGTENKLRRANERRRRGEEREEEQRGRKERKGEEGRDDNVLKEWVDRDKEEAVAEMKKILEKLEVENRVCKSYSSPHLPPCPFPPSLLSLSLIPVPSLPSPSSFFPPNSSQKILSLSCVFFAELCVNTEKTLMTPDNVGISIGPTMLLSPKIRDDPMIFISASTTAGQILSFCIKHKEELFEEGS
jgi:hypothetical protein